MGRGKLTPQDREQMAIISANINKFLSEKNYKQIDLSRGTKIPASTLTGYVKGTSLPVPGNVQKIADFFGVQKSDIDPRFKTIIETNTNTPSEPQSELITAINDKVVQLTTPRQEHVLEVATGQLEEQKKEKQASMVEETIIDLDDYREKIRKLVAGRVSAGTGAWQDDDDDTEVSFYVDDIPDEDDYDSIAIVIGYSMEPRIKNGDYLFIKHTPQVDINQIGIFRVDDNNYVKKLKHDQNGYYLESLNPDYDDITLTEDNDIRTIGEIVHVYREG